MLSSCPALNLIRELLASSIVPDRPNSITLSSSLAGRRAANRELDSIIFGPTFRPMSMVAKRLEGSRFHLIRR